MCKEKKTKSDLKNSFILFNAFSLGSVDWDIEVKQNINSVVYPHCLFTSDHSFCSLRLSELLLL